jgi:hypothetical protein
MDEATRRQILTPFFTTKSAGGETGLGLSIVQAIVKRSQGCLPPVPNGKRASDLPGGLRRADAARDNELAGYLIRFAMPEPVDRR